MSQPVDQAMERGVCAHRHRTQLALEGAEIECRAGDAGSRQPEDVIAVRSEQVLIRRARTRRQQRFGRYRIAHQDDLDAPLGGVQLGAIERRRRGGLSKEAVSSEHSWNVVPELDAEHLFDLGSMGCIG